MRICQVIEAWHPYTGGGQVHALELVKRLEQEHTVEVITRDLAPVEQETVASRVIRIGPRSKIGSALGRTIWIVRATMRILSRKYDVIHAHSNIAGYPTWIAGKLSRTPVVLTVHGSSLTMEHSSLGWFERTIEKTVQTRLRYDALISVDHRFAALKNVNNPVVIPNGVDVERFKAARRRRERFTFLFVGRLSWEKGIDTLLEAYSRIADETDLRIVGDGPLRAELIKRYPQYQSCFIGPRYGDELVAEYRSADVFVLPSRYEGQPLTLLEAWASEIPVIATRVGDNDRFVTTENGWLIGTNVDELASAMQAAHSQKRSELNRMGRAGRDLVEKNYTWDQMVERTKERYASVLTVKNSQRRRHV